MYYNEDWHLNISLHTDELQHPIHQLWTVKGQDVQQLCIVCAISKLNEHNELILTQRKLLRELFYYILSDRSEYPLRRLLEGKRDTEEICLWLISGLLHFMRKDHTCGHTIEQCMMLLKTICEDSFWSEAAGSSIICEVLDDAVNYVIKEKWPEIAPDLFLIDMFVTSFPSVLAFLCLHSNINSLFSLVLSLSTSSHMNETEVTISINEEPYKDNNVMMKFNAADISLRVIRSVVMKSLQNTSLSRAAAADFQYAETTLIAFIVNALPNYYFIAASYLSRLRVSSVSEGLQCFPSGLSAIRDSLLVATMVLYHGSDSLAESILTCRASSNAQEQRTGFDLIISVIKSCLALQHEKDMMSYEITTVALETLEAIIQRHSDTIRQVLCRDMFENIVDFLLSLHIPSSISSISMQRCSSSIDTAILSALRILYSLVKSDFIYESGHVAHSFDALVNFLCVLLDYNTSIAVKVLQVILVILLRCQTTLFSTASQEILKVDFSKRALRIMLSPSAEVRLRCLAAGVILLSISMSKSPGYKKYHEEAFQENVYNFSDTLEATACHIISYLIPELPWDTLANEGDCNLSLFTVMMEILCRLANGEYFSFAASCLRNGALVILLRNSENAIEELAKDTNITRPLILLFDLVKLILEKYSVGHFALTRFLASCDFHLLLLEFMVATTLKHKEVMIAADACLRVLLLNYGFSYAAKLFTGVETSFNFDLWKNIVDTYLFPLTRSAVFEDIVVQAMSELQDGSNMCDILKIAFEGKANFELSNNYNLSNEDGFNTFQMAGLMLLFFSAPVSDCLDPGDVYEIAVTLRKALSQAITIEKRKFSAELTSILIVVCSRKFDAFKASSNDLTLTPIDVETAAIVFEDTIEELSVTALHTNTLKFMDVLWGEDKTTSILVKGIVSICGRIATTERVEVNKFHDINMGLSCEELRASTTSSLISHMISYPVKRQQLILSALSTTIQKALLFPDIIERRFLQILINLIDSWLECDGVADEVFSILPLSNSEFLARTLPLELLSSEFVDVSVSLAARLATILHVQGLNKPRIPWVRAVNANVWGGIRMGIMHLAQRLLCKVLTNDIDNLHSGQGSNIKNHNDEINNSDYDISTVLRYVDNTLAQTFFNNTSHAFDYLEAILATPYFIDKMIFFLQEFSESSIRVRTSAISLLGTIARRYFELSFTRQKIFYSIASFVLFMMNVKLLIRAGKSRAMLSSAFQTVTTICNAVISEPSLFHVVPINNPILSYRISLEIGLVGETSERCEILTNPILWVSGILRELHFAMIAENITSVNVLETTRALCDFASWFDTNLNTGNRNSDPKDFLTKLSSKEESFSLLKHILYGHWNVHVLRGLCNSQSIEALGVCAAYIEALTTNIPTIPWLEEIFDVVTVNRICRVVASFINRSETTADCDDQRRKIRVYLKLISYIVAADLMSILLITRIQTILIALIGTVGDEDVMKDVSKLLEIIARRRLKDSE